MDQIAEIRRCYFINKESISKIAKRLNLSRQTVRKALKSKEQPVYQRNVQPTPKLGAFKPQLVDWLIGCETSYDQIWCMTKGKKAV